MAGGISINILANVRDAVKGVDDVADALDDAQGALRDITKEGDTAADRMESDFRDIARSADRASDELRGKFRDAYRSIERQADDTADTVVGSQRRMGERSAEVGQEIRQNLGEGIANAARGDFASLADTIGDTFGGAVAGIGGLGTAAAGVVGALGLGAIVAVFQGIQAEQEKLREQTKEWAEGYIEAGSTVLGAAQLTANGLRILSERHQELTDNARNWGVSEQVALNAMAGAPEALDFVAQALTRKRDAAAADAAEAAKLAEANGGVLGSLTPMEQEVLKGEAALKAQEQAMAGAADQANLYSDFLKGLASASADVGVEVDELGNKVLTLPDGKQILINAETGQATNDVSSFKGDFDGKVDQMNGRDVVLRIRADTRELEAADHYLRQLQARAEQGFTINAKPGQGRFWE